MGPHTSDVYAEAVRRGGGSHSIIRVRNLSSQALIGCDMWGVAQKEKSNKVQPILLSAFLSLKDRFTSAAQNDTLTASTVNYSSLSKEMLKVVASRRPDLPHSKDFQGLEADWSLDNLLSWTFQYLTGYGPDGDSSTPELANSNLDGGCPHHEGKLPFLDIDKLLELGLTVFLPKGLLMGAGVSQTISTCYGHRSDGGGFIYRSVLKLHDIRISTLIGVNANERVCPQIVVANVEVDPYLDFGSDSYNELEQITIKTIQESSFETLESLATHLCSRIIKYYVYSQLPVIPIEYLDEVHDSHFGQIRVCLEKPSALMFADAPAIEIVRSSNPRLDEDARRWYLERLTVESSPKVPSPLSGKLDEWIRTNYPGDTTGQEITDQELPDA